MAELENGVIISELLAERGLKVGDHFILDRVQTELEVVGITAEYNIGHVPIVYTPLRKWQEAAYGPPGGPPPGEKLPDVLYDYASIVALQLAPETDPQVLEAADIEQGTLTVDKQSAYEASSGYREEILTVRLIQGFLIVISAVVIGAFFTVWTIQRTREIGLVKALGASNTYLLRDALGQVLILMVGGTLIGTLISLWVGQRFAEAGSSFLLDLPHYFYLELPAGVGRAAWQRLVCRSDYPSRSDHCTGARTMSLVIQNVTLELGDGDQKVTALDDVSAVVKIGELTAVVGPSGAGKSSLLAVCGGLRTPTSGSVTINGQKISDLPPAELTRVRRDSIGFVFQQSNLVPALTAIDQLLLLVHIKGHSPGKADRDRAYELLNEVGMAERANRRPDQLSGGERQRVGIARALMGEPKLLLVDEPTSMLDNKRGRAIVELLAARCREHHVATLMVTHDASMLEAANSVLHITDGRLVQER